MQKYRAALGLRGICLFWKPVMKREDVRARHAEGQISATHVIQNPADLGEWIVFFKKSGGRSFFLVDDQDEVESFQRLDDLIETIRGLGIKFADIQL
jgi:1,2-phenylacetyl-CoA epoxidase PaaB subunit